MGLHLDSDAIDPSVRKDWWHSICVSAFGASEVLHDNRKRFHCGIEVQAAGKIVLLESKTSPFLSHRDRQHIRSYDRDNLTVGFLRKGSAMVEQDDRAVRRGVGTIVVADMTRPYRSDHATDTELFGFTIARAQVERIFGSSKRFTMLPIEAAHGSGPICAYLTALFDNLTAMPPETAAEMAGVGVEMVLAALARRLAQEPVLPQSAALLLHRAQTIATARIAEPQLNPTLVAELLGISLRHLQGLFRRIETTPSDWIWNRRLSLARDRLGTPGFTTLSVGEIAFGCGFSDQAHFSRRFKATFGMSPREWRHHAALASATSRVGLQAAE